MVFGMFQKHTTTSLLLLRVFCVAQLLVDRQLRAKHSSIRLQRNNTGLDLPPAPIVLFCLVSLSLLPFSFIIYLIILVCVWCLPLFCDKLIVTHFDLIYCLVYAKSLALKPFKG